MPCCPAVLGLPAALPHAGRSLRAEPLCGAQVQPNHLLVRHDSLSVVHPLDDAFTMSLKAVLRHACQRAHHHCHQHRLSSGGHSLGRAHG